MNLFEKYEKLKSSNELFLIGSVWSSELCKWKVIALDNGYVCIKCIEAGYPSYILNCDIDTFKMHFKRVK